MSVALKKHFLSQNRKGPSKDRLKPLLDRALKTPIGTKLLEDFANSNGMIKAYKRIPASRSVGDYYHFGNNVARLSETATSTVLVHELAHARQYRKAPLLREEKYLPLASDAHLSVLNEADSWALSVVYWKEFFRQNPDQALSFMTDEKWTFEYLEGIAPLLSEDKTLLGIKEAFNTRGGKDHTYSLFRDMAEYISQAGSWKKNFDPALALLTDNFIKPETDMEWMGNIFAKFIMGESHKKRVAYNYTQRSLRNYKRKIDTIFSPPPSLNTLFEGLSREAVLDFFAEDLMHKFFSPKDASEAKIEETISACSDLSDLGRPENDYTRQFRQDGKLPSFLTQPSEDLKKRAQIVEEQNNPGIGYFVSNFHP